MSNPTLQPTPYSEINTFLNLWLTALQTTLGEQLVGLYLGGSLALGDFNPQQSDIDFVVITAAALPPEMISTLEEMHTRLRATGLPWASKLDGSYVPQGVIRRWTADHPPCPFVERTSFFLTDIGSAVVQRHILHQHGIVVAGPGLTTLLEPVGADELRSALRAALEKWWRPLLVDPDWVQQSWKQPFAILTLCRTIYTLEQGVVASKPVAARWCQQALGEPWVALIEWALAKPPTAESNQLAATLDLIRYTLSRYAP